MLAMNKKKIIWGCFGTGCLVMIAVVAFIGISIWYTAKAFEDLGNPEVRKTWFDNPTKIEEAIGIRIPDFTIKEYKPGEVYFTGDVVDTLFIEFSEKIPERVFDRFEKEVSKTEEAAVEDMYQKYISVDSLGIHYSNPHLFNHDEFIDITLWRDSLNGIIVYGKW